MLLNFLVSFFVFFPTHLYTRQQTIESDKSNLFHIFFLFEDKQLHQPDTKKIQLVSYKANTADHTKMASTPEGHQVLQSLGGAGCY